MSRSATPARTGRKIKNIRNPSESMQEAEEMVRKFHGREPRGVIELTEEEEYEDDLGILGQLMELNILKGNGKSFVPIRFCKLAGDGKPDLELEDMIQLAANDKRPIYFKGGDQRLDLDRLEKVGLELGQVEGKKKAGEFFVIGPVLSIVYWADKSHLEGPKYQSKGTQYEHYFGEEADKGEWGEMPQLIYDAGNERMWLSGGSYEIRAEGIFN